MTYLAQNLNSVIDFRLDRCIKSISGSTGNWRGRISTRTNHCAMRYPIYHFETIFKRMQICRDWQHSLRGGSTDRSSGKAKCHFSGFWIFQKIIFVSSLNGNQLTFHMRYRLFLHYGWFLQNLAKGFIRTYMHTTVCTLYSSLFCRMK